MYTAIYTRPTPMRTHRVPKRRACHSAGRARTISTGAGTASELFRATGVASVATSQNDDARINAHAYRATGRNFMKVRAIALGAVMAMAAGAAFAQDKTFELRLSHWVPPSHPLQKALEDWGSSIEKASNGTIKY